MRPQSLFIISATALIAATYGLSRFGYGLFVPSFTAAFDLTATETGFISSGSFFFYCLAAASAYRMAGMPRRTVLFAGGAAAMGSIGVALSGTAMMLAISMLIAGAGAGFASPGLVSLVRDKVAVTKTARTQAVVNSGTGFGVILAGVLALLLANEWRAAWLIIAAVNVGSTVAVLISSRSSTTGSLTKKHQTMRLADLRPLRVAGVAALFAGISSAAIWTFGRSLVTTEGGLNESEATIFWICLGAAGIAGAFSGDIVSKCGLLTSWVVTATSMGLATMVIGIWPTSIIADYLAGALFGGSYVALSGVLIVWSTRAVPGREAAGTAALFITLAFGQAAGALLIGTLMETTNPITAFITSAAIAGVSLIPVTLSTRRTPGYTQPVL